MLEKVATLSYKERTHFVRKIVDFEAGSSIFSSIAITSQ
jgi:hypothetical protein